MKLIFNQRLAGFLMMSGFKLEAIVPNKRIRGYNVFKFEESDALENTITKYQIIKDLFN